jgi:hypothetical protein
MTTSTSTSHDHGHDRGHDHGHDNELENKDVASEEDTLHNPIHVVLDGMQPRQTNEVAPDDEKIRVVTIRSHHNKSAEGGMTSTRRLAPRDKTQQSATNAPQGRASHHATVTKLKHKVAQAKKQQSEDNFF